MLFYTMDDLTRLRQAELDLLLEKHGKAFSGARVLEIGTGNGDQLGILSGIAEFAAGVDVPSTTYPPQRTRNFVYYDGSHLPFADNSFDVIYSSNTVEHVLDERCLHDELKRVLRRNGIAIHVVPSSTWRIWTMAAYYAILPSLIWNRFFRAPKPQHRAGSVSVAQGARKTLGQAVLDLICPMRHGERGNRFTEWWHFRGAAWKRRFDDLGWKAQNVEGLGLFNTGYLLTSRFSSIETRKHLARFLGSSCLVLVLKPKSS